MATIVGLNAAVDSGDQTHEITMALDKTETQMFEVTTTAVQAISVYFDLDALETAVEGGTVTIRVYNMVDGAAYSDMPTAVSTYVVGISTMYPSFEFNMVYNDVKVTIQCSADLIAARTIAYRYITRELS